MRVVVLGGAGTLGREVVAALRRRGVQTVAASRRTGVDLASGAGLREVLAEVDAVVHAATGARARRVELDGLRRVLDVERAAARPLHVVYVSIVGCDANPLPYYRLKAACEREVEGSGASATVVRATQFHTLIASLSRRARPFGVGLGMRGVAAQPCDVAWVGGRVADLATGPAPDAPVRSADLAGPDRLSLVEGVRLVAEHDGVRLRRVVSLPVVGGVARSFAAGTNLPGPDAVTGGVGFEEWLADQPRG